MAILIFCSPNKQANLNRLLFINKHIYFNINEWLLHNTYDSWNQSAFCIVRFIITICHPLLTLLLTKYSLLPKIKKKKKEMQKKLFLFDVRLHIANVYSSKINLAKRDNTLRKLTIVKCVCIDLISLLRKSQNKLRFRSRLITSMSSACVVRTAYWYLTAMKHIFEKKYAITFYYNYYFLLL